MVGMARRRPTPAPKAPRVIETALAHLIFGTPTARRPYQLSRGAYAPPTPQALCRPHPMVLARIFICLAIGKNLLVELINDIPGVGVIEKDFLGRDLPKKNPDAPNSKATKTLQSVNPHSLFRKWELKNFCITNVTKIAKDTLIFLGMKFAFETSWSDIVVFKKANPMKVR